MAQLNMLVLMAHLKCTVAARFISWQPSAQQLGLPGAGTREAPVRARLRRRPSSMPPWCLPQPGASGGGGNPLYHAATLPPWLPAVLTPVPVTAIPCPAAGTINKVGADYLGLLVLGFINASIGAEQIRAELRPRPLVRPRRHAAPHCCATLRHRGAAAPRIAALRSLCCRGLRWQSHALCIDAARARTAGGAASRSMPAPPRSVAP